MSRGRRPGRRPGLWLLLALVALIAGSGPADGTDCRRGNPLEAAADHGERDLGSRALLAARAALLGATRPPLPEPQQAGPRLLLLSLSRPDRPARVVEGFGSSLGSALDWALEILRHRATPAEIAAGRLKLDRVVGVGPVAAFDGDGRARLDRGLDGLWLPEPALLLLPEELTSRRLVDTRGDLQSRRLRAYLAEEGRGGVALPGNPGARGCPYQLVVLESWIEDESGVPVRLVRGNPEPATGPAALRSAAVAGGEYLLRHRRTDGSFHYRYQPKWDAHDDGENLLRQAGTAYAVLSLYGETGDRRLLEAARGAIGWLLAQTRPLPEPDLDALAPVSPGEEAKLGGAALLLLAMTESARVAPTWNEDRETARSLARFLVHQQGPDGRFASKYFFGPPDPEPFESIYYPGEAILALARLHRLDPDPAWLDAARRGARWLIEVRDGAKSDAELPHDHWLLMALAELADRTGEELFVRHAGRIADAIVAALRREPDPPDWIGGFATPPRVTPTATRSEALVAMVAIADKTGIDATAYREALRLMAGFQLRCRLTVENSLYLPRPDRGLGGFRRSLDNWEVRVDYVQHSISALLGTYGTAVAPERASAGAAERHGERGSP